MKLPLRWLAQNWRLLDSVAATQQSPGPSADLGPSQHVNFFLGFLPHWADSVWEIQCHKMWRGPLAWVAFGGGQDRGGGRPVRVCPFEWPGAAFRPSSRWPLTACCRGALPCRLLGSFQGQLVGHCQEQKLEA